MELTGEELDIAVDPLEGTNFTAKNLPNAISVLAVTKKGGLFSAPDTYMEKIAIGSGLPKNIVDLDNSIEKNIKKLAEAKNTTPDKITACVFKRARHDKIIKSLNSLNVNIKFISDGDVTGVISVVDPNSSVDIYLGIGGGPEGVLAAAALDCLGGQMQTRLVLNNQDEINRAKKLGITDLNKKYNIKDMIKGDVIFCATGVTDGDMLNGINDKGIFSRPQLLRYTKVLKKISKKIKNNVKKMNDISVSGKNWISKNYNDEKVNFLKDNYNLSEIVSRLIAIRNIKLDEVKLFLKPKIKNLFQIHLF